MTQSMTVSQFAAQVNHSAPAPICVLVGEEDLLRDTALAHIKTAVLGQEGDAFNQDVFYGDEVDGAHIVACASEVAVFASRRLVIVKAADKLSAKHAEMLLPYLKEPVESTTLVFVAPKFDGRLKFTQALLRSSVVVDCSPLKEAQFASWLKQDAERIGLRLADGALQMLKEACGGSLYSVRRELEKLVSYVPGDRAVTAEDVAAVRGMEPGASVFDLADAIGARQAGRALAIVARNIEAGEPPLRILGSLAWQYRRLWKMKELLRQGGREGEAARTLRMDPYQVRSLLGRFSDGHLRHALGLFPEYDAKMKGGSGGRPTMLLDRLVLQLCRQPNGPSNAPIKRTTPAALTNRPRTLSNVRTVRRAPQPGN